MQALVDDQLGALGEGFAAAGAGEGTLAQVGSAMLGQVGADAEASPALRAAVGPLARVPALMDGKVRALQESLAAVPALVRPLARVDAPVLAEGRALSEAFAALGTQVTLAAAGRQRGNHSHWAACPAHGYLGRAAPAAATPSASHTGALGPDAFGGHWGTLVPGQPGAEADAAPVGWALAGGSVLWEDGGYRPCTPPRSQALARAPHGPGLEGQLCPRQETSGSLHTKQGGPWRG